MTDFVGRTLRCPICNTGFSVEVPVGVRPVASETDFRPVFEGPDPIAADMHACPRCRYAGYAEAFEGGAVEEGEEIDRPGIPSPVQPLGMPDEDDLDDLRRWIRRGELVADTDLEAREPTAAERYLLATRCRDYLTEDDPLPLADLYLRGAWCARAAGDSATEGDLLGEAVDLYDAALDTGKVPTNEKGRVIYLAAELARRAGDFGAAVDLFGQVDANVELDEEEGLRLHRLARRMEALASVQSDVAARMPDDEELEAAAESEDLLWREDEDGEDGDED
ncbi:DUF2225 domain-containing protein [Vulgatibacter sp.]|uniref:DUF2225 domain-containing protein n=1 Tax=Vulgatibacter sp. TaxID=1971226 RepID=UPI003563DB6B